MLEIIVTFVVFLVARMLGLGEWGLPLVASTAVAYMWYFNGKIPDASVGGALPDASTSIRMDIVHFE